MVKISTAKQLVLGAALCVASAVGMAGFSASRGETLETYLQNQPQYTEYVEAKEEYESTAYSYGACRKLTMSDVKYNPFVPHKFSTSASKFPRDYCDQKLREGLAAQERFSELEGQIMEDAPGHYPTAGTMFSVVSLLLGMGCASAAYDERKRN